MSKPDPSQVKTLLEAATRLRGQNKRDQAKKKLEQAHGAGALNTEHASDYQDLARKLR